MDKIISTQPKTGDPTMRFLFSFLLVVVVSTPAFARSGSKSHSDEEETKSKEKEEPPQELQSLFDAAPGIASLGTLPCGVPVSMHQLNRTVTLQFGSKNEPVDRRHIIFTASAVLNGSPVVIPFSPKADNYTVTGTIPAGVKTMDLKSTCFGKSGTVTFAITNPR